MTNWLALNGYKIELIQRTLAWHVSVLLQCFIMTIPVAVLDYTMLTCTACLFKWHQLLISHTLPSLFLSLSSSHSSAFLLICNLQFKYISQNTALLSVLCGFTVGSLLVWLPVLIWMCMLMVIVGVVMSRIHAMLSHSWQRHIGFHRISRPLLPPQIPHRSLSLLSNKLMHFIPWTYPHVRC